MHARAGIRNDSGFLQVSGSQLKQDFLGLPPDVNNAVAGSNGKMINSSADDKRGIIKLGITPREYDEYILTYINQDGQKDNPRTAATVPKNPDTGNGRSMIKRVITIRGLRP